MEHSPPQSYNIPASIAVAGATGLMDKQYNGINNASKPIISQPQSSEDNVLQRSICVRNVEYSATIDEIKDHFKDCCGLYGMDGIKRVTICKDKYGGHPVGQVFLEFSTIEAAQNSKKLDESLFKD